MKVRAKRKTVRNLAIAVCVLVGLLGLLLLLQARAQREFWETEAVLPAAAGEPGREDSQRGSLPDREPEGDS